jgi:hypothetical protein
MSDTSIDEELPMAEGATPRSPLVIPLSPSVTGMRKPDEQVIDEAAAAQLIGRMGWDMTAPAPDQLTGWDGLLLPLSAPKLFGLPGRDLTEDEDEQTARERAAMLSVVTALVLQSVPEEYRTPTVLSSIDLRPYILAVQSNPEVAIATTDASRIGALANFPNVYADELDNEIVNVDMAALGIELESRYTGREIAAVQAERGDMPLTEAEITQMMEVTPEMAGLNAAARSGAADALGEAGADITQQNQVTTGQLTPEEILAGAGQDVFDPGPIFSREEIEQYVRQGAVTVEGMAEDMIQAEVTGGTLAFDYDMRNVDIVNRGPNTVSSTMSVIDAIDYPNTLDDSTFTLLQDRLARAGYFTRLGLQPERGYQFDDATHQAWRLALNDSVKRGVTVPQLLGQQETEWQTRSQERMRRFSVTDTRLAANTMAQEVLGRNLSGDEYNVVRGFLQSMQNQRRTQLGSGNTDNLGWLNENMDLEVGFGENDIAQAVDKAVATDVEAYAGGQAIQALNGFFDVKTPMAPK